MIVLNWFGRPVVVYDPTIDERIKDIIAHSPAYPSDQYGNPCKLVATDAGGQLKLF